VPSLLTRPTDMPKCLAGFERIQRYWDGRQDTIAAKILPGEFYVTVNDEMIVTVLGSCVSACIVDPVSKIGGMNHFMLPAGGSVVDDGSMLSEANRYGGFAMENLINNLLKNGARRDRLVSKVFGGGRILRTMTDVGAKNIAFVKDYLQREDISIESSDLGGDYPRKVCFFPQTGKVRMQRIKSLKNDTLLKREETYQRSLTEKPVTGDVDLF